MRFSILYEELKFSDVFSAASPEEAEERMEKYPEMQLKEVLDNVRKTKRADGTWLVNDELEISFIDDLVSLKDLNVSRVSKSLICTSIGITSFEGFPKEIGRNLSIAYTNIKSMNGCPKRIGGAIYLKYNHELTSLEGLPKKLDHSFICYGNKTLTSLKGCPERIRGYFTCVRNNITSLEGFPKFVGGNIKFHKFGRPVTPKEIEEICVVSGEIQIEV